MLQDQCLAPQSATRPNEAAQGRTASRASTGMLPNLRWTLQPEVLCFAALARLCHADESLILPKGITGLLPSGSYRSFLSGAH